MEAATDGKELLKGQGAKLLKKFSKTKQKLNIFYCSNSLDFFPIK